MTRRSQPRLGYGRAFAACLALAIAPVSAKSDVRERALQPLGWLSAAPTTEALAELPAPIARPAAPLDADVKATDLLTGGRLTMDVRVRGGAVVVRQSDGCVWSRSGDWFTPSSAWSGCGDSRHWREGKAEVRELASIWPLRIGAEGRWTRTAVSATGRSYARDTACRVTGAETVLRRGRAPTPSFRVECRDGEKRVRITWFAAGEGPIAFVRRTADGRVEEAWVRS